MTENKRFTYDANRQLIVSELVDCLNNFHEENEQLKKILGFLKNDNANTIVDVLNLQQTRIKELKLENEQLKQSFIDLIDKKIEEFQNGDYGDLPCNTIHMFLDLKEELKR